MWDGGGERAARGVGGGLAWAGHGRRATCGRNLPGTWLFYAVRAARFVGRSVSQTSGHVCMCASIRYILSQTYTTYRTCAL